MVAAIFLLILIASMVDARGLGLGRATPESYILESPLMIFYRIMCGAFTGALGCLNGNQKRVVGLG